MQLRKQSIQNRSYGWPRLMWIPTAAEYIGARPFFVEELIRSGEVLTVPVGNRKAIPAEELDRWVDQQIAKATSRNRTQHACNSQKS